MAEQSPSQLLNDWVKAAEAKDAKTLANFYTTDAVLCATPEGIIETRTAIEKDYEQNFAAGWVLTGTSNQSVNPGTDQDWAWAYGQWSGTAPNQNPPPNTLQLTGCWSTLLVNQGTSGQPNWLIKQHTIVTNLP